jgi:hypothetical protein
VTVSTVEELIERIDRRREECTAGSTDRTDLVTYIKHLTQPLAIRVTAEAPEEEAPPRPFFRVLLSCARDAQRAAAVFEHQLARRANGLILRVPTTAGERTRVLVQPPNNFTAQYSFKDLTRLEEAGCYRRYVMREGTTVTLYQHEGRWIVGSRRSYEADALIWRGHNFRRVLDHALKVACPRFSWTALKPDHHYTIGYHHPAHHPFGQSGMWAEGLFEKVGPGEASRSGWLIEVWFIRSTESAPPEEVAAGIGIPLQKEMEAPGPNVRAMLNHNREALDSYRATLAPASALGTGADANAVGLPTAAGTSPRNTAAHMGYILRSTDEGRTGALSDVLLPSSLYIVIRDLFYESAYRTRVMTVASNHRHLSFVLLSNYLNPRNAEAMRKLFPQFSVYYSLYETVFKKTAEFVALMARGIPLADPGREDPPTFTAYLLALRVGSGICSAFNPEASDRRGRERAASQKVLMSMLRNPHRVIAIYDVIHVEAPQRLARASPAAPISSPIAE